MSHYSLCLMKDIFCLSKHSPTLNPQKPSHYSVSRRQIQLTEVTSWHKPLAFAKKKIRINWKLWFYRQRSALT